MRHFLVVVSMLLLPLVVPGQRDSGFVQTKDGQLFYRIWGTGAPLLVINGGPGLASRGYEIFAEKLAEDRQVILFDQRGTGKSDFSAKKLRRIYWKNLIQDLEEMLQHLGILKWDILGHSFGGTYALYYTAKYPEHVGSLVLSATKSYDSALFSSRQNMPIPDPEVMTDLERQVLGKYLSIKSKQPDSVALQRRLRQALFSRYYTSKAHNIPKVIHWFLLESDPYAGSYTVHAAAKQSGFLKTRLNRFTGRVLILHGIGDFLNLSHPLSNQQLFSDVEVEILEDSGHMMSIDQPEQYFTRIKTFLKQQ